MLSFTSSFVARLALLAQVVPLLLLISFAVPAQAVSVPARHVLRRDNSAHHGEFRGDFGFTGMGNGASSSAVDNSDTTTSTEAEVATTTSAAAATTTASSSGTSYSGEGTYFYQEGQAGACGTVHADTDSIVAVTASLYSSSLCGKTVTVTYNSVTVTAIVADECPGCAADSLDLSVGVFQSLADLSVGVIDITWTLED
ncbi:RlpA-like double-psi beta-barrel-protein domain-containing protein-containing protein [Lentinula aciculospora]|uniref:RlpA-like double-psi beta-barrel-protein domain-containing protein-containing protein n=1 Tax=Lentinula aciculospora TaxID=153920 RepID=A0A9W8ZZ39_9AGAR|nr:RlpA-like double-psi beta-barrel-protein domain-containing protein-containing protein [Lentinula aciculospora]